MATVLFITEQYIKETSIIDENVDMHLINQVIKEAQDIHIHPILGTGLYNDLITKIIADSTLASQTAYKTLLDSYIQPALKYWVIYEGIDVFTYKFMNKSIVKKNSENSQPIDSGEVIRLMERWKNKAEWYSERLTKYLIANIETFTLYSNPGSTYDTIVPSKSNFDCGIYLGPSYKKKSFEERYQGNLPNCDED